MIREREFVLSLAVLGISHVMLLKAELAGLEARSPTQVETGVCGSRAGGCVATQGAALGL